jgi:hypothetical protein
MNVVSHRANNPRLSRIRKFSSVLKFAVLVYVFVPLGIVAFHLRTAHSANGIISIFNPPDTRPAGPDVSLLTTKGGLLALYASQAAVPSLLEIFAILGTGIFLLAIVSFYRLLGLYERGVFFSAANVAEMKNLAGYLVFYGLLCFAADALYMGGLFVPWSLLGIVASPWIVAGGAVYLVAWIMDEGRKIQEEQELTV